QTIQAVIARMAANSFTLKGWSVTAASALLAFAAGTKHQWVAFVALLPTVVFWALDGYYLALERRFRDLFNAAAGFPIPAGMARPACYSMDVRPFEEARSWSRSAFSGSVIWIHAVIAASVVVVAIATANAAAQP